MFLVSRMVLLIVEDSGFELVYKIDLEMLFKVNYSILFPWAYVEKKIGGPNEKWKTEFQRKWNIS